MTIAYIHLISCCLQRIGCICFGSTDDIGDGLGTLTTGDRDLDGGVLSNLLTRLGRLVANLSFCILGRRFGTNYLIAKVLFLQSFSCFVFGHAKEVRNFDVAFFLFFIFCIFFRGFCLGIFLLGRSGTEVEPSQEGTDQIDCNNTDDSCCCDSHDRDGFLHLGIHIIIFIIIIVIIFIFVLFIEDVLDLIFLRCFLGSCDLTKFFKFFLTDDAGLAILIDGRSHSYEILIRIDKCLLQVHKKFSHIGVSPLRALLGCLEDDLLDGYRNIFDQLARRSHLTLQMLDRNLNCGLPVEGNNAGCHLVHYDSERIDIRLSGYITISRLLGRRIMYRAHNISTHGVRRCSSCDTEIGNLDLTFMRDNDVLRLNITMDDALIMSSLDTTANLNCDGDNLLVVQMSLLLDIGLKGDPLDIFHYDVVHSVFGSDIVDIDDIRMFQTCSRLCFCTELRYKTCIFSEFTLQNFHCHITL